jgi:hypothetical protein
MHRIIRYVIAVGFFLFVVATSQRAYADLFELTWTGAYGPGDAILKATKDGNGIFTVVKMTGIQDGSTISGLSSYGDSDNLIYLDSSLQLDFLGLGFEVGSDDYNLFGYTLPGDTNTYTECISTVALTCTATNVNEGIPVSSLEITRLAPPVPEPASVVLLGTVLIGVVALLKRKMIRA